MEKGKLCNTDSFLPWMREILVTSWDDDIACRGKKQSCQRGWARLQNGTRIHPPWIRNVARNACCVTHEDRKSRPYLVSVSGPTSRRPRAPSHHRACLAWVSSRGSEPQRLMQHPCTPGLGNDGDPSQEGKTAAFDKAAPLSPRIFSWGGGGLCVLDQASPCSLLLYLHPSSIATQVQTCKSLLLC